MFASLVGLALTFAAHVLLACGWLTIVYPGFASASETQAIQRRVDVIATLSLEHEMRSKTAELCGEKDQRRRDELNDDISKLQREYREVTTQWYQVPRCDQL